MMLFKYFRFNFLVVAFFHVWLSVLSREWSNAEGQVVVANLLRYEGDQVTIEREDGQIFTFSEETLSKADRDYLREYRSLQNQERQQQVLADFNNPLLADVIFVGNKGRTLEEIERQLMKH